MRARRFERKMPFAFERTGRRFMMSAEFDGHALRVEIQHTSGDTLSTSFYHSWNSVPEDFGAKAASEIVPRLIAREPRRPRRTEGAKWVSDRIDREMEERAAIARRNAAPLKWD